MAPLRASWKPLSAPPQPAEWVSRGFWALTSSLSPRAVRWNHSMKNASTEGGISTVPLRILLQIWMRQRCFLEGFAEVQEMTCIERSGSSHRTLVLAAGDVETIRIWSTYPLK